MVAVPIVPMAMIPQWQHFKSGTFNEILTNVKYLKENYPKKYEDKIEYILTIHPFHDIKKIEEFFLSNEELFNKKNVTIQTMEFENLRDSYKKKWAKAKTKQWERMNTELDKEKWFYEKLLFSWLERIYTNPTQFLTFATNFTGTCFPGRENIFVTVDGSIHICEKINSHFPIGNVFSGFDMEAISQILKNWNEYILRRRCWDCDAWWLCNFCFANRTNGRSIQIEEKDCQKFLSSTQESILNFLNFMEKKNETNNSNRYSSIDSYLDSL